jgi:hypothetical protein
MGEDVENSEKSVILWTEYMKYKTKLRGFEFSKLENILRHSEERYLDTTTQRVIAVGKHDQRLVIIPYELHGNDIIPVTIHATTRQQINFRLKTGRFIYG